MVWFKAVYYANSTENYEIDVYSAPFIIFSFVFILGSFSGGFVGYGLATLSKHFKK